MMQADELVKAFKKAEKAEEILELIMLIKVEDGFPKRMLERYELGGIEIDGYQSDEIVSICKEKGYRGTNLILWDKIVSCKRQLAGEEPETEELAKYRALFEKDWNDQTKWNIYGANYERAREYTQEEIVQTKGAVEYMIAYALEVLSFPSQTIPLGFRECVRELQQSGKI